MVLVAPRPLQRPTSGAAAAGAGGEVLALLRDAAARPSFDPGLAGGLRAWLEDAAYRVVASRGDLAPPLVLGARELLGPGPAGGAADGGVGGGGGASGGVGVEGPSEEAVVSRLVHALFRRLVVGDPGGALDAIEDPLGDALDACRAEGPDGSGATTVASVEAMDGAARAALGGVVASHAAHLTDLVPRLAPAWMPRTDDRVAIPLAGGRVVLHGTFDLLVGLPRAGTASLCALGLCTGGSWARERRSLHYLALLETLRSGIPPFRLALLETGSGRYGIEDVREEHLRAIASHLAAWLDVASGAARTVVGAVEGHVG
jgi:hypothetical protein